MKNKYVANVSSSQLLMDNFKGSNFQDRIEGIDNEMKKIDKSLGDFIGAISEDFNGIMDRTNMVKKHMSSLKAEKLVAENDLKILLGEVK